MLAHCQNKRADIWNPSIVYSIGQMNHYCGTGKVMLHRTSCIQGIVVLHATTPMSTPGANIAKTHNESMRGCGLGLLGQTISIIHRSVDLHFIRVQCKQAPSCEVFVYWWAFGGLPGSSVICLPCRRPPVMPEIQDPSLVWEDPLDKEMATHSSILAWRIPWTEELAGYSPRGLQRIRDDWSDLAHMQTRKECLGLGSISVEDLDSRLHLTKEGHQNGLIFHRTKDSENCQTSNRSRFGEKISVA